MRRHFYLIRHCQPEQDWHTDPNYCIPPGPSLSLEGRKQAFSMSNFMREVMPDLAICSELARSQETATIALADQLAAGMMLTVEPAFNERRLNETWHALDRRVWPAIKQVMSHDEVAVIFTHGAVIRSILHRLGVADSSLESLKHDGFNIVECGGIIRVVPSMHNQTEFEFIVP